LHEYFYGNDDIFITENTPEALARMIEHVACSYRGRGHSRIRARIDNAFKIYQENFATRPFQEKLSLYLSELE
jgi:hypothetical protein